MKKYGLLKIILVAIIAFCASLKINLPSTAGWDVIMTPGVMISALEGAATAVAAFLFQSPIKAKYVSDETEVETQVKKRVPKKENPDFGDEP